MYVYTRGVAWISCSIRERVFLELKLIKFIPACDVCVKKKYGFPSAICAQGRETLCIRKMHCIAMAFDGVSVCVIAMDL